MSDGPYKSLKMRKAWRDVAERAHKDAFSLEERADGMCVALHDDFKRDVGKSALNAIANVLIETEQGNLFADQAGAELEAIRNSQRSTGFFDSIIEHIQVATHQGFTGEPALIEGLNRAGIDQARGNIRAVEEHYHRDTPNAEGAEKAASVRANLDATLQTDRVRAFGAEVIQLMRGESVSTKLEKDSDLDAGPVVA
ncbi:MAG: hypothetical protein AAF850_00015 [Pseudomonadota bacterium]